MRKLDKKNPKMEVKWENITKYRRKIAKNNSQYEKIVENLAKNEGKIVEKRAKNGEKKNEENRCRKK